ncbi:patatin-like phospholipase family protein [Aminobacter anthyllidis]|uniref:Patatin-like phospholipase family protein n=1 Tax=Aminobacter anthyllidis TaxID=1035067 RepID=A0A9X1AHE1_9HYPH|nr:patatin-like phospholipase family protein [Aminobacter anthyllidis]
MTYRAFVAFSGGGAKGIVHVGALKALEERAVQFEGLSGTSAGSIVAALVAAGFKADELIDGSGATILNQLSRIDPDLRSSTDLFGKDGWKRVKIFRALLRMPFSFGTLLMAFWGLYSLLSAIIWFCFPRFGLPLSLLVSAGLGFSFWYAYRTVIGGLADLTRFRDALDRLLQEKIFPLEPQRVVTMADFGVAGRPSLKIVSANLTRRSLHLFSAGRTPKTPVADAVAASICLPVIFMPWKIDGELHVDGGIVSNLPAWPFDEERELDPEALTIAVEIEEPPSRQTPGRYGWLPAAVRTALSGSGELNIRVSGPAEQLALPTRLDLLDFDVTAEMAAKEVRDVAAAAGLRLDKRLFRLPEIYRNACQVAQALVLDGLGIAPGGRGSSPRVRVGVGRLERGYGRSLRLSHSVGFEEDADESMLVPLDGSVAGAAWTDKQSILEVYPLDATRDLPGPANRLRRKSRLRDLAWVMCIPILDDETGEPRLLVQLDGNSKLSEDAKTLAALTSVEEAVKDFFGMVLHELKDLEDDHGLQK